MASKLGQGATEYLVLLAVVLVIALVAIALLMGNLGESMEKRVAESNIALMSGYPIAAVEPARANAAGPISGDKGTVPFFYMVNSGSHPITITKILANGYYIEKVWAWKENGFRTLRELFHDIAPGETFGVGYKPTPPPYSWQNALPSRGNFDFFGPKDHNSSAPSSLPGIASEQNCARGDNYLVVKNFGFEYEENINGNIVTKQQVWKEVVIRCDAPNYW